MANVLKTAAVAVPLDHDAGLCGGRGCRARGRGRDRRVVHARGLAYRTFTRPVDDVRRATLPTLKRMDIALKAGDARESGRQITADAGNRSIDIELETLTARTTRMRITARYGVIFRDRATAGAIIVQTERALQEPPALTKSR